MAGGVWTEERIERMRELKARGLSAAQTAKALNADRTHPPVTRNAVVSIWKRSGLSEPRKKYANGRCEAGDRKLHPKKAKFLTELRAANAAAAKQGAKAKPAAKPTKQPRASRSNVAFIDRVMGAQCPMFLPGEEGALGFVCGAASVPGFQWCRDCLGIVYDIQPVKKTARAA